MDLVTEANEFYEVTMYPEKEEERNAKQGLTIKGKEDEYARAVEFWRNLVESKDSVIREDSGIKWRIILVRIEKDRVKGTICLGEEPIRNAS